MDTNCETDDDCIIKNSICNTNTKRCDCDFNAIQSDNRCECSYSYSMLKSISIQFHSLGRTLHCRTSQDCSSHFGNTICVFGTCRCRWGLKANGKCVDLDGK